MQGNSSFSAEIKNLEERLAKFPDSFCFAKLSEIYLKQGAVAAALFVARQGVAKHPAYLAGQRALALACHAQGLHDESLALLRRVTEAQPEDQDALKLLGHLLIGSGDREAARQAFQTALEFYPDDIECQQQLQSLGVAGALDISHTSAEADDDNEIIEDLEILEELDVLEDDQPEAGLPLQCMQAASVPPARPAEPQQDPLSTGTLAELYVSQGFIHKALDIYRDILNDNPANVTISTRIAELEALAPSAEPPPVPDEDFYQDECAGISDEVQPLAVSVPQQVSIPAPPVWSSGSGLPQQGSADNALDTLEGWLENIRRVKSCR